jgi:hypothetical protein
VSQKLARDRGAIRAKVEAGALVGAIAVFGTVMVVLAAGWWRGLWFVDAAGRPMAIDFINFWTAGRLAEAGEAARLYDVAFYRHVEVMAIGHDFAGSLPWPYPPMLLLLVAPLSDLPFMPAWLVWTVGGMVFMLAALRRLLPWRLATALLLGTPASLWCITLGQNGFLTAGLMIYALELLGRGSWIAGVFIGLLTYKPQFGLLFPVFLILQRRFAVIAAAVATVLALAAASALVFGAAAWQAFVKSLLPSGLATTLDIAPSKMQSVFALAEGWTGSTALAAGCHVAVCALIGLPLLRLWSRKLPADLAAASLIAGCFVVNPRSFVYDTVVLTAATAFLLRDGMRRGFLRGDGLALCAALCAPALVPVADSVSGPLATLLLIAVTLRRAKGCGEPARLAEATSGA